MMFCEPVDARLTKGLAGWLAEVQKQNTHTKKKKRTTKKMHWASQQAGEHKRINGEKKTVGQVERKWKSEW